MATTNQTKDLAGMTPQAIASGDSLLGIRGGSVLPLTQASLKKRAGEASSSAATLSAANTTNGHWYRIAKIGYEGARGSSAIVEIGTPEYNTMPSSVVTLCVSKGFTVQGNNPNNNERAKIEVVGSLQPNARTEPKTDIAFPKARIVHIGSEAYLDVQTSRANGLCASAWGVCTILGTFEDVTSFSGTVLVEQDLSLGKDADILATTDILLSANNVGGLKQALIDYSNTKNVRVLRFLGNVNILTNWGNNNTLAGSGSDWTCVKMSSYNDSDHFTYLMLTAAADAAYLVRYSKSGGVGTWNIRSLSTTSVYSGQ